MVKERFMVTKFILVTRKEVLTILLGYRKLHQLMLLL